MKQKCIALFWSVVLALTVLTVPVSARSLPDFPLLPRLTVRAAGQQSSLSLSEDVSTQVAGQVSVQVSFSGICNAYDLKLNYDTDHLRLLDAQAADATADITKSSGTVRIIGYGEAKTAGTALATLRFQAEKAGQAKVDLTMGKVDLGSNAIYLDAPKAKVADGQTVITIAPVYPVTLDTGLTADSLEARTGENYVFRATDYKNYTYAPTATCQGKTVTVKDNGDGTFTISGDAIIGELTIKANRTPKSYKVTLTDQNLTGEKTATYGSDYVFRLQEESGYSYTVVVTINGKNYTDYSRSGETFTIPGGDITGPIRITVKRTANAAQTVKVTFTGTGAGDGSGKSTATLGQEYTFRVNRKTGYLYSVTALVGGKTVQVDYDSTSGNYAIAGEAVMGNITIVITKTAAVAVNEYITLNSRSLYLILYRGNVAKGQVPMYDGQCMYWSEDYQAYAWLVTSTETEKEVQSQAEKKVTLGTGEMAGTVDSSGNVDLRGGVTEEDAQMARDMYNAEYTLADMEMLRFLNADVNGDQRVNVLDGAAIVWAMKEEQGGTE